VIRRFLPPIPVKASLVIGGFLLLAYFPVWQPRFRNYRIFDFESAWKVLDFRPRPETLPQVSAVIAGLRETANGDVLNPRQIQDAAHNMDHFYQALFNLEQGDRSAVVRILHYGDSPTTADLITADARELLQQRFGDAGHGFLLIAQPWAWYGHRGFRLSAGGWMIDPAVQAPLKDGLYGIGGVSFRGDDGSWSQVSIRGPAQNEAEIAYLQQPFGGQVVVSAGGVLLETFDTAGPYAPAFRKVALPSGARHLELLVIGGPVRMFGIDFRRNSGGIVYSSLGLNGAYVSVLSRMFNGRHWIGQLRHYHPQLVVINYGTNESVYEKFVTQQYAKEMTEVIRRIRAALPDVSILIMSPMDRATRDIGGEIVSVPAIATLVDIQQRLAKEKDCGFFNTYEAMGGAGTMEKWYNAEPRLVYADFIHPSPAGAKILGKLLYQALMDGYNRYKLRKMKDSLASFKTK
jgi:lysophospholipase L1-like esterase